MNGSELRGGVEERGRRAREGRLKVREEGKGKGGRRGRGREGGVYPGR